MPRLPPPLPDRRPLAATPPLLAAAPQHGGGARHADARGAARQGVPPPAGRGGGAGALVFLVRALACCWLRFRLRLPACLPAAGCRLLARRLLQSPAGAVPTAPTRLQPSPTPPRHGYCGDHCMHGDNCSAPSCAAGKRHGSLHLLSGAVLPLLRRLEHLRARSSWGRCVGRGWLQCWGLAQLAGQGGGQLPRSAVPLTRSSIPPTHPPKQAGHVGQLLQHPAHPRGQGAVGAIGRAHGAHPAAAGLALRAGAGGRVSRHPLTAPPTSPTACPSFCRR